MYNYPFGPPAPPPQPPPEQAPQPEVGLFCDFCNKLIPVGDEVHELFPAVVGLGQKSGMPTPVQNPLERGPPKNLHPRCVIPFYHRYYDEEGEFFCARCGTELEGLCEDCSTAMERE